MEAAWAGCSLPPTPGEQLCQWCELLGLQEPALCPPHWRLCWAGHWGVLPVVASLFSPSASSLTLAQQYQLQTWLWELGRSKSPSPSFHGGLQTPRDFLWANPDAAVVCHLPPDFPLLLNQLKTKKITCRDVAVKQKSKLLLWKCNSCDRGTKTWV